MTLSFSLKADERYAIVVHSQDNICPVPDKDHDALDVLRARRVIVQYMDIKCWQVNRLA